MTTLVDHDAIPTNHEEEENKEKKDAPRLPVNNSGSSPEPSK